MGNNKENAVMYGGASDGWDGLFWLMDNNNPIHLRYTVEFDHEIDSAKLAEAWNKTKQVYPIIDCVPEVIDGEIFYFASDEESLPVESKNPIIPCGRLAKGRPVFLTYYKNQLSVNAYHSLVDGGGLTKITHTVLYFYLTLYTGEVDEVPHVQTKKPEKLQDYYRNVVAEDIKDFEHKPLVMLRYGQEYFVDPTMNRPEDEDVVLSELKFPSADFMKVCKENGANPAALLSFLVAKTVEKLYPDNKKNLALSVTMDTRKVFGRENCISNCISSAMVPMKYEDTANKSLAENVKKIRGCIDYQKDANHVKTIYDFMSTMEGRYKNQHSVITYMKTLDVGVNTKHITGFSMGTNACTNLYMIELNGEFILMLQYGMATEKYTEAIKDVLQEWGIDAKICVETHSVLRDTDEVTK